jgi:hypothetical protein
MKNLNKLLVRTLGLAGVGFVVCGLLIQLLFPGRVIAVLIDRSYCPESQWQQVVQQYDGLYKQHQLGAVDIQAVVLFSNLGEEVKTEVPRPKALETIHTYGQTDPQRQQQVQKMLKQQLGGKYDFSLLVCP